MKILDVKNISKSFKNKIVLDNISFSISQGEIIGLVGPNGAGKSTIMKIISGLLMQNSGSVEVCGITIMEDRLKYLSNLSSIIETPALYEELTGFENIDFIRKVNNISVDEMNKIISFVNIKDSISLKVNGYSLGMKQRLALGIALLTNPKLLILDEPTNGLDPEGVLQLREMLKSISKEYNTSILISSHILSELDKVCDKILFVKDKKLIKADMSRNMNDYQIIMLLCDNKELIKNELVNINIVDKVWIKDDKLYIRVQKENKANIFKVLAEKNISFTDVEIINNSSESYYEELYLGGTDENFN